MRLLMRAQHKARREIQAGQAFLVLGLVMFAVVGVSCISAGNPSALLLAVPVLLPRPVMIAVGKGRESRDARSASQPTDSRRARVEELAELLARHRDGELTDEEYAAAKQRVLD